MGWGGRCQRGWELFDWTCWRDILRWILAVSMELGHWPVCEAWPGGEINWVDSLATGIYNGDKSGPVQELYQGGKRVHVVHDFGEDVGLEGSVGCTD